MKCNYIAVAVCFTVTMYICISSCKLIMHPHPTPPHWGGGGGRGY